ncbi:hypothetical protein [Corallococcus sp. Z5C101001]|uniref:hypothetical protein n=1 Tax=Corallococcus sp. Z5C101001 TaxID=2596829 RepID=UPI00117E17B4|nr:hypothetical protein [Corallococcus sp. Z5C101001]TSC19849.1 hypothetical protein FOF48_35805 [Corallococcus sp. Z5C101001]
MSRRILLCGVLVLVAACSTLPPKPSSERRPLRVVLFPYIPDSAGDGFASLKQRLEQGFEQHHPDVDLEVVMNEKDDLYDLADGGTLEQLFGSGPKAAQVVEVDTLLLGELVEKGWVQAVPREPRDVIPAARQAVSIQGRTYGTPTYLCTNVVYARDPAIHTATDGRSLVRILSGIDAAKRPLATNYSGSWTLPAAYMDAWADTHPTGGLEPALALPLDPEATEVFAGVVKSCKGSDGANPCLDKTYADNTLAEEAFALGQANGFMGYTERLFPILKAQPAAALPQVISVPLGGGTHPVMFVDALTVSARCVEDCSSDALALSEYMSRPEVRTLIAFSQDAPPGSLPRYLLQASQAFYQRQPARSDPMYQQYLPIVRDARVFPNQGYPGNRKALQTALLKELQAVPVADSASE